MPLDKGFAYTGRVPREQKTTAEARPPKGAPQKPTPLLYLLHHPERGVVDERPWRLAAGRHPIGREVDEEEGIRIDDIRASRLHAVLHVAARSHRVRLADEGSKNGTFVNGERVDDRWLEDGDVVRLADSHFLLRMDPPDVEDAPVDGLIGRAPAIRSLRATISQVAPFDVTVLLLGQSGTGKEVVAAAIHRLSGRKGAFVAINCAAIPEDLAESQLFGHVAGAFTGARSDQEGFFRAAHGGTILLDEIGDLSPALQPKLLRALEQRAVMPVGVTSPCPCDVRVIAATNRWLDEAVAREAFRGDLYARISEFTVQVPLLTERREDVLLLLRHAFSNDGGEPMPPLQPDLVDALLAYGWPFNVRELMAVGRELRVRQHGDKPLALELVGRRLGRTEPGAHERAVSGSGSNGSGSGPIDVARGAPPTREEFELILRACKGNVRRIAKVTGRSRMQVYRWVEQFGLDLERFRDSDK